MAKQKGILHLEGTIGDITFYKYNGKWYARMKSSLDKEKVMTAASFANSRLSMTEFGWASLGAQLFRLAFALTGKSIGDRDQYARLTGFLRTLMLTDTIHGKGERRLSSSNLDGISDFNWNKTGGLHNLLMAPIAMLADQAAGTITATIPALDPSRMIHPHPAATHYRIIMEGAALDFDKHKLSKDTTDSGWLSLSDLQPEQVLQVSLRDTAGRFLFGGIKLEFGQLMNGHVYEFYDKTKLGFSLNYLGQVPAASTKSAAEMLANGAAAVKEALDIIDWKAAKTAQEALLTAPERKPAPKKGFVKRLMGTGKHQPHRKVQQ